MTTPDPAVVTSPEALTPDWLAAALDRPVPDGTAVRIGTGQIGACYRVRLDRETTVLAKLPAPEPSSREILAGAYRSEHRFYTQIAPTVAVRVPRACYAALEADTGDFVLLLEDLAPAEQGDQIVGCSDAQALDAAVNLAGLHGPRWCDPTLLHIDGLSVNGPEDARLLAELYGDATGIFLDALGDRLSDADVTTLQRLPEVIERWALERADTFALVHGDYRLDNLLFPPQQAPGVIAVDWQTLSLAHPLRDLAYFAGTSLHVAQRRRIERDLVGAYHRALTEHGVRNYSVDQAFADYRFGMLQGPLVSVFGQAYGTRSERGEEMFVTMISRCCAAIRDLDTFATF